MRAISLQSGSNGNCIYVEAGDVRLLLDAGISGSRARERMAGHGRDIERMDALLISHDHTDHSRSLGVFQRQFGVPVYVTTPTLDAAAARSRLGKLTDIRTFRAGDTLRWGNVSVETISTPHDGADGVVFVVDDGRRRLGVLTDLGHVFDALPDVVASLDAVLLESNYEPWMLDEGPYPAFLKRRIRGPAGHLSNGEAAGLLRSAAASRLQWICLAHLSEDNNHPETAVAAHRGIFSKRTPIQVAGRYEATGVLEIA